MSVNRASIVSISAQIASMNLENNMAKKHGYTMSKAALNMMTKNLSTELKRDKILCVSMHPGWVRTDMGGDQAQLSVEESVQGMYGVLGSLGESETGTFFGYDGQEIDW